MSEIFAAAPLQTAFDSTALQKQGFMPSVAWINWFVLIWKIFNQLAQRPNFFSGQAMTVIAGSNNLVNTVNAGGGGTVTMSLPPIANQYLPIRFIKTSPDGNTVTIAANGPDRINGAATKILAAQYAFCTLVPDGNVTWYVF